MALESGELGVMESTALVISWMAVTQANTAPQELAMAQEQGLA